MLFDRLIKGLALPVTRMSLAPGPHALGVFRPPEMIAVGRRAQPSALAGQFAGLSTSRLAAVMLVMLVAMIEEEKITANAEFKSLGFQGQGGPKRPRPRSKEKPNTGKRRSTRGTKKSFQQKFGRKYNFKPAPLMHFHSAADIRR
jgi:hypothetical protein